MNAGADGPLTDMAQLGGQSVDSGGSRTEGVRSSQQASVGKPSDDLVEHLLEACRFPDKRSSLDCAVSGGADSTALLILATATGAAVTAFHVDHGIRPDSGGEAEFVAELAHRFGAGFEALRCEVEDGPDLEARARLARHRILPAGVLLGHTMDDQAETVLLRLLRGTGPVGLAAMSTDQHPLLGLRRRDTEALCEQLGIIPFEDPSNSDPRFRRNRVRSEVLPLLNDVAERDVVPLLARLATQSSEQSALIEGLASGIDPTDALGIAAAPRPLAAQALRSWWLAETGEVYPPDSAAVDRMLDVAAGSAKSCEIAGGWVLSRSRQRLRLSRQQR